MDNTLAYNVPYTTDVSSGDKRCGFIKTHSFHKVMMVLQCRKRLRADILCQVDRSITSTQSQTIQIQVPSHMNFSLSHTVCGDHVTLSFLPCDVSLEDTSCDVTAGSPCRHGQLHSYFLCRDGDQQVSYTFLCDHRQDCWDESDEDFCSFADCDHSMAMSCGSSSLVSLCSV